MNAFAVTLFCRPDHIPSFDNGRKRNKKCLWLRRGCNYFLHVQTETSREEGTELWCDTGISQCGSQKDSGKDPHMQDEHVLFQKSSLNLWQSVSDEISMDGSICNPWLLVAD